MTVDQIPELKALIERLLTEHELRSDFPDPFALAEAMHIRVRYFPLGGLKGFSLILNDIPFIAIDKELPEPLKRIVCAHELGHHVLHHPAMEQVTFNDYDLYRMENRYEREANLFASLLLLPDGVMEELCLPENRALSRKEAAYRLQTTEELLAIRLDAEGNDTGIRLSRFPSE